MKHIQKRSFDVYLPGSKDKKPQFLEKIEVEVENKFGEEFLTQESRQRIENIRARQMGLMTGEDIKALRKRLKLSQDELTSLLQCGEKSLSRWENGHGFPIGTANAMLRLLDEDFLAPVSLMAVQGPRRSRHPWAERLSVDVPERKTPLHYKVPSTHSAVAASKHNSECLELMSTV